VGEQQLSLHVNHMAVPEDLISSRQEIAYGSGARAKNLLGSTIGYMSIAFDVGRGMNLAQIGTRQVMGCLSENTGSRCDCCRPYSFTGAVIAVLDFSRTAFSPERPPPKNVDKYQIYKYDSWNFSAFLNGMVTRRYWWFRILGGR